MDAPEYLHRFFINSKICSVIKPLRSLSQSGFDCSFYEKETNTNSWELHLIFGVNYLCVVVFKVVLKWWKLNIHRHTEANRNSWSFSLIKISQNQSFYPRCVIFHLIESNWGGQTSKQSFYTMTTLCCKFIRFLPRDLIWTRRHMFPS